MPAIHAAPEMLQAARLGFQRQRAEIDAKIAEIRAKLAGRSAAGFFAGSGAATAAVETRTGSEA